MSDYDQQLTPGNANENQQNSFSLRTLQDKEEDPYDTDHLPKLSEDMPLLEFKPLDQIKGKASLDRQTKLLLEDGEQKTRGWQLTKQEFIAQVELMVDTKVNDLLKFVGFSTKDCPWLEAFYAELGNYSAGGIEVLLRQYLGKDIEATNDFLEKLSERIEAPVKHWIRTREIQDVPELAEQKMAETQPGGSTNGHFKPLASANQSTSSIPAELRGQLEEFLGATLDHIKLHSGSEATKMLQDKQARALAVGQDVYLDLTRYSLDTFEGVGILAHEIIHAQQQMGATSMDTSNNSEALEQDADNSLLTLLRRWMKWGKGFAARASMKSGLKVAKCSNEKKQEQTDPLKIQEAAKISPEEGDLSNSQVQKGLSNDQATTSLVKEFESAIQKATKDEDVLAAINGYGQKLWMQTSARIKTKKIKFEGNLYWGRIWMHTILKTKLQSGLKGKLPEYVDLLEKRTRNMTSSQVKFVESSDTKKVLISGFDPFGTKRIASDSHNISGTVAMHFDGKTLDVGKKKVHLIAVIFPVTYKSFNGGMIENFYMPYLDTVDAIVTFSQGGETEIDIERFYANHRRGYKENNHEKQKGAPVMSGTPEFYETNLPVNKMILDKELKGKDKGQKVFFDQSYETDKKKTKAPHEDKQVKNMNKPDFDINDIKGTAREGSGGGFLSNELPYRVAHLINQKKKQKDIKYGHIHLPFDEKLADQTIKEVQQLLERLTNEL